jgi:hypothetical protein
VTAADLYELVRDLPEVWPVELEYVASGSDPYWSLRGIIPTVYAADLILAGVVRKLLELDKGAKVDRSCLMLSRTGDKYNADHGRIPIAEGWDCCDQPTPLHAALAAYRKAKP